MAVNFVKVYKSPSGGILAKSAGSISRTATGRNVLLNLDEDTNRQLIRAKERSRRSKTSEAYLRLKDHLERFPDFYNSELTVPGGD